MSRRRSLSVARHEAAHAVVGVYLGLALRRVKVAPPERPEWEGYAWFRYGATKRLAFGVMCAAGAAGARIHGDEAGDAGDRALAASHGFTPKEWLMLRDLAGAYLRGPLRHCWRRVTAALLER